MSGQGIRGPKRVQPRPFNLRAGRRVKGDRGCATEVFAGTDDPSRANFSDFEVIDAESRCPPCDTSRSQRDDVDESHEQQQQRIADRHDLADLIVDDLC